MSKHTPSHVIIGALHTQLPSSHDCDGSSQGVVTAKWSVRADREKQFTTDFAEYLAAESDRRPFEYVFVTNEFDPARLMRACDALAGNSFMFTHVVHINRDAIRATYGSSPEETMKKVIEHMDKDRLLGIDQWIGKLTTG